MKNHARHIHPHPHPGVSRFSVSLPQDLARDLDHLVDAKHYSNRSQAIADMVRQRLVEHHGHSAASTIAGTITLVYDHHKPHLQTTLTDIQHHHHDAIISTLHVHLDHHHCLEVLVVLGPAAAIHHLADALIAVKGVTHGKLTVTTTQQDLPG